MEFTFHEIKLKEGTGDDDMAVVIAEPMVRVKIHRHKKVRPMLGGHRALVFYRRPVGETGVSGAPPTFAVATIMNMNMGQTPPQQKRQTCMADMRSLRAYRVT